MFIVKVWFLLDLLQEYEPEVVDQLEMITAKRDNGERYNQALR